MGKELQNDQCYLAFPRLLPWMVLMQLRPVCIKGRFEALETPPVMETHLWGKDQQLLPIYLICKVAIPEAKRLETCHIIKQNRCSTTGFVSTSSIRFESILFAEVIWSLQWKHYIFYPLQSQEQVLHNCKHQLSQSAALVSDTPEPYNLCINNGYAVRKTEMLLLILIFNSIHHAYEEVGELTLFLQFQC